MLEWIRRALLVEARERAQVAYLLLLFLLIGTGMALGRGAARTLFFTRYGIEHLPTLYLLLGVVMAAACLGYAALADRYPAETIFRGVFRALVALLLLNWLLMVPLGVEWAYPLYFLSYEVASEIILVHVSLYLAQNLDTLQLKRLSGLLFAGMQVGCTVGGLTLSSAVQWLPVTASLFLWSGLLLLTLLLLRRHHRRLGASPFYRPGARRRGLLRPALADLAHGARFLGRSPLLAATSAALFCMVVAV